MIDGGKGERDEGGGGLGKRLGTRRREEVCKLFAPPESKRVHK